MVGNRLLRKIGVAIDRRYLKKVGASTVPDSSLELLLVCFHPYAGKIPVELEGLTIKPGETVGELHLSNIRITEIATEPGGRSLEWRLMEMLKEEFQRLGAACANGKIPQDVQGFYGVNVLAAGARRLGFTLIPIPRGWNRWWLGFWESLLRLVYYSFKTSKKAKLQKTMDPYQIWITREQLIKRYARKE